MMMSPEGAAYKKMNAKSTIKKVLFIAIWLCIGGGMFTLLMAAISNKNKGRCKDYRVIIKGARNNFFIDKNDVAQLLLDKTKNKIKGQPVASFNLHVLEGMLEDNTWIDEAELYFDNRDVLHITVTEKEPVARIFTAEGNSFYIDSAGRKMPLSDKLSARVPVFTNFPDKKTLSSKDSLLLNDVRVTANFIVNDPFWMSQVAQIDITGQRTFEMFPVVGNHLVKLGTAENIEHKFRRLLIFYKQVVSKTGFDKYKMIDVQYKGQVLASKSSGVSKVDSARLRKNVEKLLQQAKNPEADSELKTKPVTGKYIIDKDSVTTISTDQISIENSNPEKDDSPNPMKSSLPKSEEKKEDKLKQEEKKQPKAVMPKNPAVDAKGGFN